jgi:hypothetical protein
MPEATADNGKPSTNKNKNIKMTIGSSTLLK